MAGQGILSGLKIAEEVERGVIEVEPYEKDHINPASLDLRLGDNVTLYERWVDFSAHEHWDDPRIPSSFEREAFDGEGLRPLELEIDVQKPQRTKGFKMCPEKGWVLLPGILYLMHTMERVRTDKYVPIVDGKSSIGRLGVTVHVTAGFGDPGFDGQYTLEVVVVHPVRIYPGMRFCQIRFHTIAGDVTSYQDHKSNYRGTAAVGAVPSAVFKQFQDEGFPSK